MCGIAGFYRSFFENEDENTLIQMGLAMAHRGPDASGEYFDDSIGLVHRRLSIIDLSPSGDQPMASSDNNLIIVFNGEIYNFLELRQELVESGYPFKTRTDTEVILALFQREGIGCLDRLNGMFAFAVWDRSRQTLWLARDRIGKKPLYYFYNGSGFAFASEIKSLLLLKKVTRTIDPTALTDYLKYLYVPAPKTIFRNIHKLLPGHFLEFRLNSEPGIKQYWDVDFSSSISGSMNNIRGDLFNLIKKGTEERMIADVPLGAFLSGGVDSSAVVGLMAQQSTEPVKTCSIGFNDKKHDETPFAREIANLFKTEHHEYFVKEELTGIIKSLPIYFDEPFADSSAVPTFYVSKLAKQAVTVVLSGDGGDENFAGYEKYVIDAYENQVRNIVPRPLLSVIGRASKLGSHTLFQKAGSLSQSALMDSGQAFYQTNTFILDSELQALLSENMKRETRGHNPADYTLQYWNRLAGADHLSKILYTDLKTYLSGDILVKVDRMSMANSLEVRSPILDYRVIEYAAKIPSQLKLNGKNKKYILKEAFKGVLPQSIMDRKKQGFTVPLDRWFRTSIHDLAKEYVVDNPAMDTYFNKSSRGGIWEAHQKGKRNYGTLLWTLLMFSLWHERYME